VETGGYTEKVKTTREQAFCQKTADSYLSSRYLPRTLPKKATLSTDSCHLSTSGSPQEVNNGCGKRGVKTATVYKEMENLHKLFLIFPPILSLYPQHSHRKNAAGLR
jgi:hypothetical protein